MAVPKKSYSFPVGDWEPVRDGEAYCSRACGASCTREAYAAAHEAADRLAARLYSGVGSPWTTRVWENLGWHWEVRSDCGHWSVSPARLFGDTDGYTAMLGLADECHGGRWYANADTPEKAIEETRKTALAEIRDLASWLGMKLKKAKS